MNIYTVYILMHILCLWLHYINQNNPNHQWGTKSIHTKLNQRKVCTIIKMPSTHGCTNTIHKRCLSVLLPNKDDITWGNRLPPVALIARELLLHDIRRHPGALRVILQPPTPTVDVCHSLLLTCGSTRTIILIYHIQWEICNDFRLTSPNLLYVK